MKVSKRNAKNGGAREGRRERSAAHLGRRKELMPPVPFGQPGRPGGAKSQPPLQRRDSVCTEEPRQPRCRFARGAPDFPPPKLNLLHGPASAPGKGCLGRCCGSTALPGTPHRRHSGGDPPARPAEGLGQSCLLRARWAGATVLESCSFLSGTDPPRGHLSFFLLFSVQKVQAPAFCPGFFHF